MSMPRTGALWESAKQSILEGNRHVIIEPDGTLTNKTKTFTLIAFLAQAEGYWNPELENLLRVLANRTDLYVYRRHQIHITVCPLQAIDGYDVPETDVTRAVSAVQNVVSRELVPLALSHGELNVSATSVLEYVTNAEAFLRLRQTLLAELAKYRFVSPPFDISRLHVNFARFTSSTDFRSLFAELDHLRQQFTRSKFSISRLTLETADLVQSDASRILMEFDLG